MRSFDHRTQVIAIEPLRALLQASTSEESSEEIDRLIRSAALPVRPTLRRLLEISIAERVASTEAKALLKGMSEGAAGAPETQAAIEAINRLGASR